MPYYHVLLTFNNQPKTDRCLFSDLSEKELRAQFVRSYRRGKNFLCGSEVVAVSGIRKTTIIRTDAPSAETLKKIQEKSRRETDELNRGSDGVVFFGLERGHQPEDITEGGEDVTSTFIIGPPGHGDRWAAAAAVISHPWISAIGTGLIVAALIWLFGWT